MTIAVPFQHAASSRPRKGQPNPVDVHVGGRIRMRRMVLGMSQGQLGEAIGLTFQQVQKYERGTNRIGASRLFDLSRVLDVPVSFFFDELPAAPGARHPGPGPGLAEDDGPVYEAEPAMQRETLDLIRAYYRIRDPQVRRRMLDLMKSLGEAPGSDRN